jgi:putative ABC transport system permease protein
MNTINKKFIHKIIKHYLKYDRDNPFIFISMLLAFLGISAGVMVLMVAMGIMNGTEKEFQKRLFVMNYPLTLIPTNYNSTNDDLISKLKKEFPHLQFSPYYTTQVITKSGSSVNGSILYGVDFSKEAEINNVFKKALKNSLELNSKYKMLIGKTLANDMSVYNGQKLTLYFSEQQAVGFGTMPLQKRFSIIGQFDSGLKAYDKAIIYTTLEAFEKILKRKKGIYDGIHVYSLHAMKNIKKIREFLRKNHLSSHVIVEGWWEQNRNFFAAMEMEKRALFLVLLLIILVASLNIISSLLMTVMSRRSEIALMRTLGATTWEIKRIFFKLGVIIGVSGIIAGTVLGFLGIWVLQTFDVISLSVDVYGFSKLPVDLTTFDFISIIGGTIIIVILSSLYPAYKASSTDPLTVLRNE